MFAPKLTFGQVLEAIRTLCSGGAIDCGIYRMSSTGKRMCGCVKLQKENVHLLMFSLAELSPGYFRLQYGQAASDYNDIGCNMAKTTAPEQLLSGLHVTGLNACALQRGLWTTEKAMQWPFQNSV